MNPVTKCLETHWKKHVADLERLIRIPSVSFDGFPKEKVRESAREVAEIMRSRGLENVEVMDFGDAHPYVYGDWLHAPGKPTILLYAHHDVQPPGRDEKWESPPFEPTYREGEGGMRLFGRGSADDKAGIIVHTASIASYLETVGKLPVNVKLIVEGEEEIGSTHLEAFLKANREKLSADIMILTDTANFDCGVPSLTTSLRGLVGIEIELRSLSKTVHSGFWGGMLPCPVIGLSKILATLVDANGRIGIPEIVKDIPTLDPKRVQALQKLTMSDKRLRDATGLVTTAGFHEFGVSLFAQTWFYPSLSVNAIQASSREQASNIINDVAWTKITMRVPPGMDAKKMQGQLVDHLKRNVPWGLELHLTLEECAAPWSVDADSSPAYAKAAKSLEVGYGRETAFIGCGATIPFAAPFSRALGGIPALLIGVEDPYTNAHGENESVPLEDLKKACLAEIDMFERFGSSA